VIEALSRSTMFPMERMRACGSCPGVTHEPDVIEGARKTTVEDALTLSLSSLLEKGALVPGSVDGFG
jgi:hypothetical protein